MTPDRVPTDQASRPAKVKDVLIAVLALSLCFSLAALIHETRQHQQYSKLYAEETARFENLQKAFDQSTAEAGQAKAQSDRALRRAQVAMKAGYEAQGVVLRLRESGRSR